MFPCASCKVNFVKPAAFPIKKGGEKCPLTPEEIKYYSEQLSGIYKIGEQLGRSGNGTSAYLLTDSSGKQFALKVPNDSNNTQEWMDKQKKAMEKRDAYVGDYNGPILIPKTIQIGSNFIVEELASGREFSQKVYDSLSAKDKAKLVKDFAFFLNKSHQRTFRGMGRPLEFHRFSLQTIFEYFKPALGLREKIAFPRYQKIFETAPQDPEVLAFRDYRSQNMLWDDHKKQLSIIDFDCTRYDSVYSEFTPGAAASYHGSYQFLKDVITAYNLLPKKHPIFLDPERVKANCMIGIYHEFGRCGIDCRSPENQLRWLRPIRRQLERAFRASRKHPTRTKQKRTGLTK